MSYVTTIDVFCDECGEWIFGSVNGGKRDALRRATAAGWAGRDGKHICPDCAGSTTTEDEDG